MPQPSTSHLSSGASRLANQFNITVPQSQANVTTSPPPPEEDNLKTWGGSGKFEVRPGIMFDPEKAETLPKEDYFFGLFEGPSPEAYSYTTEEDLQESFEVAAKRFKTRLTNLAEEVGGKIDPLVFSTGGPLPEDKWSFTPTETSLRIEELADMDTFQSIIGFADTTEEYTNALTNALGEGNFKILEDTQKTGFEAKYYISVKREDGSFTDYSPVTRTITDYYVRLSRQMGFDIATGSAALATATGLAMGVGAFSGPAAVVTMPIAFMYGLYAGGKGAEKAREFLKEEIGLKENEANSLSRLWDGFLDAANPMSGTLAEKLSGGMELLFSTIPGVKTQMRIGLANIRAKYIEKAARKPGETQTLLKTQEGIDATQPGGAFEIKGTVGPWGKGEGSVSLKPFILTQVVEGKVIGRLGSLAEQTSLVIPTALREQMQSAVAYLQKYSSAMGKGNFKEFQKHVKDFGLFVANAKKTATAKFSRTDIGENINALSEMWGILRASEAKGLYANVFDKLKKSSYDLNDLRELLPSGYKTIIPVSDPGKQTFKKTESIIPKERKGEPILNSLVDELMSIGRFTSGKDRILTPNQIKAAVDDFAAKNPGFEFDYANVDSPAKILQMYASRFGTLARETFGPDGSATNPAAAKSAMKIRNALLDLIGNPREKVDASILKDLQKANNFYKETFKTTEVLDTSLRGARADAIPEPADTTNLIIGSPGASGVTKSSVVTMQHINKMENYVRDNIQRIGFDVNIPEGDLTNIKKAFRLVLNHKLARSAGTKLSEKGEATDFITYLESFDPDQLRLLGIDEATELKLRDDAEIIAKLTDKNFFDIVGVNDPENMPFKYVFETLMKGDSKDIFVNMSKVAAVAKQAVKSGDNAAALNIRQGFLDFIISKESGIIKTVDKSSPYARAGTDIIDVSRFKEMMDHLNGNPAFKDILTPEDFAVLNLLFDYTTVIQQTGADAGAALAGAQIIGNMYTLDPRKFLDGVTRLVAQRRIAKFITSETVAQRALALEAGKGGPVIKLPGKLKAYMFGETAVGAIMARFAMQGMGEDFQMGRGTIEEQTDAILEPSVLTPGGRNLSKQFAPSAPN